MGDEFHRRLDRRFLMSSIVTVVLNLVSEQAFTKMRRYQKAVHLTICQTSLRLNTINDRRIRLKGQAIDLLGKAGDETWRRSIQSKCSS